MPCEHGVILLTAFAVILFASLTVIFYSPLNYNARSAYHVALPHITAKQYNSPKANRVASQSDA